MTAAGKEVRLQSVARSFGETVALQPTDLCIAPGEFLTLLGPSGSGKTTVLNLVAGYLEPTSGRVFVDGQDVTDRPPRLRPRAALPRHERRARAPAPTRCPSPTAWP